MDYKTSNTNTINLPDMRKLILVFSFALLSSFSGFPKIAMINMSMKWISIGVCTK